MQPSTARPRSEATRWAAWAAGFGGSTLLHSLSGTGDPNVKTTTGGVVVGLEYRFSPETVVGVSLSQSATDLSTSDGTVTGRFDATAVAVYGTQFFGSYYATGRMSYTLSSNSTQRIVPGLDQLNASNKTSTFGARIEAGHHFVYAGTGFTPFAALEVNSVMQPTYTENSIFGAAGVNVTHEPITITNVPMSLGLQFDARFGSLLGTFVPYIRVAWVHEIGSLQPSNALTDPASGSVIGVQLPTPIPRDSARVDAGAKLAVNQRVALFANFTGQVADRMQNYTGMGGLHVSW